MKTTILMTLALLFCGLAEARLAVISDIDDTIKVSHVLDKSDALKKAFRTQNLFRGMNVLYREIARLNRDAQFYYVTNAPKQLMYRSHAQFLTQHKFPNGALLLREDIQSNTHKVDTIRRILNDPKIKFVLYIGDNGERDPEIYAQMRKEFPTIPAITYIRQAYSVRSDNNEDKGQPLHPGQIGFMTPVEISDALTQIGFLTSHQVKNVEAAFVPKTIQYSIIEDRSGDDGILSFPRWIDCRDFTIPESLKRPGYLRGLLLRRLMQRCSIPAIED